MTLLNGVSLKGSILGFENCENYMVRDAFGDAAPFFLLECQDEPTNFIVVDPFFVDKNYQFEVDDGTIQDLQFSDKPYDEIVVLCIVRVGKGVHSVNLRAPLIVNASKGLFRQIVLQNETYQTSTLFRLSADQDQGSASIV
jgi:flagellar assembly factor FliW